MQFTGSYPHYPGPGDGIGWNRFYSDRDDFDDEDAELDLEPDDFGNSEDEEPE